MISDNTAGGDGGGISYNDSGTLNLAYVTISNNSANGGNGMLLNRRMFSGKKCVEKEMCGAVDSERAFVVEDSHRGS